LLQFPKGVLDEQELQLLTEALSRNGINVPDLRSFLQSFENAEQGTIDLGQASDTINTAISETTKSETERLFNAVLAPLEPFWPYIIALSFLLSALIFVPVFVYLGLFFLKISMYLLTTFKVVHLAEDEAVVSRYVLK